MRMKKRNRMKEDMKTTKSKAQENEGTSRRGFIARMLFAGTGLAAGSLALAASQNPASAQTGKRKNRPRNNAKVAANPLIGRRRLGTLEVSSIGMGVQNMHRNYQTTVPYRPDSSVSAIDIRGQRLPDAVLVFSGVESPPKK